MMDEELIAGFTEEVQALLLQLEEDLMSLDKHPNNAETINSIFRVMHTLKGSAGMCGFSNIQDLTHEFEGMYELVRNGNLEVNSPIIDLTLKGKDLIISMLNNEATINESEELIKQIRKFPGTDAIRLTNQQLTSSKEKNAMGHLYIVFFSPDKAVFERGLNPDKTLDELKNTGETHILLHENHSTWEKQKAEKKCNTTWEIYIRSSKLADELAEAFLFYDPDEFRIFEVTTEVMRKDSELLKALRKYYKSKVVPEQHIKEIIELLPEISDEASLLSVVKDNDAITELLSTEILNKTEAESTINVSSRKLDEMMNLVSELVTLTAIMEVQAARFNDPKLQNTIESIEKLTKKFRNNALDVRLVPVGALLTKFKRQVRDLSKDLNKKVNLLIEGQDIEIDKTILKSIESPMQHIIRNSIDHGIEPAEERLRLGKTPEGLLKISAFYSGANVIIQVQDDGRGINLEKVRECAIRKGIIQADQLMTKQELINLTMEPGFTTADNISLVSGRGVGMDVVRKELNRVGGSLEIFTEKDLGTSIILKLPTTLTIIDTLMVDVGDSHVLIPIMDIEYCFKGQQAELLEKDNKYVQYKNNPIPLVSLREQFKYPVSDSQEMMVIVINKFDRKYAIIADHIVGEHQAVIKPLGELFVNQPYFSGGSIMVDGKLALILDTNFLFQQLSKN